MLRLAIVVLGACSACARIGFEAPPGLGDGGPADSLLAPRDATGSVADGRVVVSPDGDPAGRDAAGADAPAPDVGSVSSPHGFFVAVRTGTRGANLGGLAGANAHCLAELQNRPWYGQATALAAGQLAAANVQAWLCDGVTCQDLRPFGEYALGSTVNPQAGGYAVVADGMFYPDDGLSWEESFPLPTFEELYTGRRQNDTPLAETCNGFTTNAASLATLVGVSDTAFAGEKRSKYRRTCDNDLLVICIVHPLP